MLVFMKKLQQRKMRDRSGPLDADKPSVEEADVPKSDSPSELNALRKRVKALEADNSELRLQITTLREQLRMQERSPDAQKREQQHNYLKYSNARRY